MARPNLYENRARRSFAFMRVMARSLFRGAFFLICLLLIFSLTTPQIQLEFPLSRATRAKP